MERRSRPPFRASTRADAEASGLDGRSLDLALQLAALRSAHALDDVIIAELDGRLLAGAGDPDVERRMVLLALHAAQSCRAGDSMGATHCRRLWIEPLELSGRTYLFAAKASHPLADPHAMARALEASFRPAADAAVSDADDAFVDGRVDDPVDAAFDAFFAA
jgi:hypothetical protein